MRITRPLAVAIAGASSRIGLATAIAFARGGKNLALAARDEAAFTGDGAQIHGGRRKPGPGWSKLALLGALAAVPILLAFRSRRARAEPRPLGLPF
jgi:NAD(P)-dependent dehydrogenase (short-subunit alcohol dehydrogenase family)